VTKPAEIEVNMPDNMPKVIDLSGLGPKKVYDITLPEVGLRLECDFRFFLGFSAVLPHRLYPCRALLAGIAQHTTQQQE
jgi:hypothetical protein